MSVAILVLAHRAPAILSVASTIYREAEFDIFVHLDAKADLNAYRAGLGDEVADRCAFVDNRVEIYWAGFSMIQATVALLRKARDSGPYSNFVLVSDDTFPVRPLPELRSALATDHERICISRVRPNARAFQRYERFFCLDHQATALRGRPIESSFIDDGLFDTLVRMKQRKVEGKAPIGLFYGSQWCALTGRFVEHFLHRHDQDATLRESFEFSAVPDEMYIHCVMMNSSERWKILPGPVLVDWNRRPRPYVFTDCAGIQAMLQQEHLFVRKLAPDASALADEVRARLVLGKEALTL